MKSALVIASYKEYLALPVLLEELSDKLSIDTLVVIADDSPQEKWTYVEEICRAAFKKSAAKLEFSFGNSKGGRGAAIVRGFQYVNSRYPEVEVFLESDADGSHSAVDITRVLEHPMNSDVVIGSRYLKDSKIVGWPISRRIFSRVLNFAIPRITQVPVRDITNGLRRYNRKALNAFMDTPAENTGFIYLTEQAIAIRKAGKTFSEIPIVFVNRTLGSSTVGLKELFFSVAGIVLLAATSR